MIPGEFFLSDDHVAINVESAIFEVEVSNTGDRPIQVGSHFHFFETNDSLIFDRSATLNCRLAIPSGTAVRFEPGQKRVVSLMKFSGLLGRSRDSASSESNGAVK